MLINSIPYNTIANPGVEERINEGKELRNKFPIAPQGDYQPARDRRDPISILQEQELYRLPDLLPIRYARMITSPFAFLRGAASIMAADLATSAPTSGIQVQTCGDLHIANFGVFASAERNLIFGINDFDETLPGPWEWDLKRLVASIVVGAQFLGGNDSNSKNGIRAAVSSYRAHMHKYARKGYLELWYTTITENKIIKTLSDAELKRWNKIAAKAKGRTNLQVLAKMTDLINNQVEIRTRAPFVVKATDVQLGRPVSEWLQLIVNSYLQSLADDRRMLFQHYKIRDIARKVVGVGSVGMRCWIIYLTGNSAEDPLFLQIKEAQPSVLESYIGKSEFANAGERVVAGQKLLQGAPDIFLGWGEVDGIHFYVRQLRDMKGGVDLNPQKVNLENISVYCSLCGWALALAHAKSGDAAMISGYIGSSEGLDNAMIRFGFAYANQTRQDHALLVAAAKSGRIKVAKSGS